MLVTVHTSDCCYGGKGVEGHREFAKQFLGKQMWQTDQINPTEIMHSPKGTVPSCPSTLSLIMWLLLSSVGVQISLWISEGALCWPCTSVHTWLPHTQSRHFTPAWFGEIPSAFHASSSLASPFPPKPPFSRIPWGESIQKMPVDICSSRERCLRMTSKQPWDVLCCPKQRGAGKARSSWRESSCTSHYRSCNSIEWILISSSRLVQESRGKPTSALTAASPKENTVKIA